MYEMYPDAWTATDDDHSPSRQPPRRRARKKHSVQPAVLERHARTISEQGQAG
jgi:hypothetical protein